MLGYDIGYDAERPAHLEPKCDEDHERCTRRFGCICWPFDDIDDEDMARDNGLFDKIVSQT